MQGKLVTAAEKPNCKAGPLSRKKLNLEVQ
jgi:hypothetical protein